MTTHINILIATPGHSMLGKYVSSILATSHVLSQEGISWSWLNGYSSHVGDAREITLSDRYRNNVNESRPLEGQVTYDKIFWIDSDIEWSANDFLRLYKSDLEIVSGAYMLENGEVTAYPTLLKSGLTALEVSQMTEPIKVESVGFGFLAVKQGIFEQLSRPWFQSTNVTTSTPEGDYTFPVMGEDMAWCKRVRDLGYEIWLDPSVRVAHYKTMRLGWEHFQ